MLLLQREQLHPHPSFEEWCVKHGLGVAAMAAQCCSRRCAPGFRGAPHGEPQAGSLARTAISALRSGPRCPRRTGRSPPTRSSHQAALTTSALTAKTRVILTTNAYISKPTANAKATRALSFHQRGRAAQLHGRSVAIARAALPPLRGHQNRQKPLPGRTHRPKLP